MATEICLPRLTDTMHTGVISYWYKKEGDIVKEDEPLFVVETDKASLEVTASTTGVLLKIDVMEGGSIEVGGRVAIIGEPGEDIQSLLTAVVPKEKEEMGTLLEGQKTHGAKVKASPAAKRKAKEEKIDLNEVIGTGENGLITEKDIIQYLEKGRNHLSLDAHGKYGSEELITLEGVRRTMAERMTISAAVPQVTTVAETDISDLIVVNREISATITSFVIRAVAEGLKLFPWINSSLDGEKVIIKKYYNIGVSVASPRGLIVPVIHNAENKDIYQITKELAGLAKKSRESILSLEEVSGRTFTVTNSGVFGSLFFTPRVNPPESAVLGTGKIMKQAIVIENGISIRSMMYLCLSYDHRIIDGETAVKFLQEVKRFLESPRSLLKN